jgi:hypothetical protein
VLSGIKVGPGSACRRQVARDPTQHKIHEIFRRDIQVLLILHITLFAYYANLIGNYADDGRQHMDTLSTDSTQQIWRGVGVIRL